MNWEIILWLISFIVFWGYVGWYIYKYGIPKSWSDTFYILNKEKKGRGYIFTGILWGMLFPLLPLTVEKHPLMFPALAAIAFVGAAPAFKSSKLEGNVHVGAALTSVIITLVALFLSYNIWFIATLITLVVIGLEFKWKPENKTMWIESMVIFTGQIIILIKDVLTI